MAEYYSTSAEWVLIGWLIMLFNIITIPVILYHLYLYYLHRNLPFFRARLSNITIYIVLLETVIVIHRLLDALIGMGMIADNWFIGTLITYIEFFPWAVLYSYKFCLIYIIALSVYDDYIIVFLFFMLRVMIDKLNRVNWSTNLQINRQS